MFALLSSSAYAAYQQCLCSPQAVPTHSASAAPCIEEFNQLLGVLLQAVDMLILSAGLYIWRQLPLVGRLAAPVVSSCAAKHGYV